MKSRRIYYKLYSVARCMCSAFAPAQCGNSVANDKHFREIEKRASRVDEMS